MGNRHWGLVLVAAVAAFAASAADAQRAWMSGELIRGELVGHKLAGIYPDRIAWSEVINADGTSDYQQEGLRQPGRWRLDGQLFCFTYSLPLIGGCFRVSKHSANCYEIYFARDGDRGRMQAPPSGDNFWNGRMWREHEKATCEESVSS